MQNVLCKTDAKNLRSCQPSSDSIDSCSNNPPHVKERGRLPEPYYEFDCVEEGPYWEPSNIEDELRSHLNKSGVLHISKDSIQYVLINVEIIHIFTIYAHYRLLDELGSGEFGVVRRGVWSVGGEEREVAVKSLADGSTKEKRVQFLQEAAIMGQFKHPNVITLHGVLIDHNPVRKSHMFI